VKKEQYLEMLDKVIAPEGSPERQEAVEKKYGEYLDVVWWQMSNEDRKAVCDLSYELTHRIKNNKRKN